MASQHGSAPIPGDDPCAAATLPPGTVIERIGFAASGGGYRAMLFHLGGLWRLNEFGWLTKIDHFSAVSGGALAVGTLGAAWSRLQVSDGVAANFRELVAEPIIAMAKVRLDVFAVIRGLLPLGSGAEALAHAYRKYLVHDATLYELPHRPTFTFNTTNVQTGADFRFSRKYMRDYRVGCLPYPRTPLAFVLAASSSFPPFLSPCVMELPEPLRPGTEKGFDDPRFRRRLVLSDGGVYDNLGLQPLTSYRTIIASDGGSPGSIEASPRTNWLSHGQRVASIAIEEARRQRRNRLLQQLTTPTGSPDRLGTFWKIDTNAASYRAAKDGRPLLRVHDSQSRSLAAVSTRLWPSPEGTAERLINLGYALCDASMRCFVDGVRGPDPTWPFADFGLTSPWSFKSARPTAGGWRPDRA
jgi:NTE family protein